MNWLVFAFIALAFSSTAAILQKRALAHEHTLEYLVVRGAFTVPVLLAATTVIDYQMTWPAFIFCCLTAFLAAAGMIHRYHALKHAPISTVEPLLNTIPLLVTILAFLILGETPTTINMIAILLIVVGAYTLELDTYPLSVLQPVKNIFSSTSHLTVIVAAGFFAAANIVDRFTLTTYLDPWSYLITVGILLQVTFTAWHAYKYNLENITSVLTNNWAYILPPALCLLAFKLSFFYALELTNAGVVVAIIQLKSFITTVAGGNIFDEDNLYQKSLACLIMVAGAALIAY
jgi:uncharacterized membrane protein